SLAIASLVDEVTLDDDGNKLSWKSQLCKAVKGFRSRDKMIEEHCTLDDILSHRTGIPSYDSLWLQSHNKLLLKASETLHMFEYMKRTQQFRTKLEYNNFGY